MKKISVLIKRPGVKAYHTYISNTLENLQKTVGGYIETVTPLNDLVLICNEEGRIKGLPYNFTMFGVDFFGTVIFAGVDGDEFCDVPFEYKDAKQMFPRLFEGGKVNEC